MQIGFPLNPSQTIIFAPGFGRSTDSVGISVWWTNILNFYDSKLFGHPKIFTVDANWAPKTLLKRY